MRPSLRAALAVTLVSCGLARAQAKPEVLMLWPGDPPATGPYDAGDVLRPRGNEPNVVDLARVVRPSMAVYRTASTTGDAAGAATPAVIICPGGGYAFESVTYEGVQVAERCAAAGITAFVLRYRLPDGHAPAEGTLPVPQQDVLRAVQLVRSRAADFGVDPKRVGVIGFSAGGHLAATAATLFDQAASLADKAGGDATSKASARPDFAVLLYPVITMNAPNTHTGSRKNLVGPQPGDADVARFSAEAHVTPGTPPLLIIHAADDGIVPVANAVLMADAAAKHRVPCELILLSAGGHGFGLGKPGTPTAWFDRMAQWMTAGGLLGGAR